MSNELIYLRGDIDDAVERVLSYKELKNCNLGKRKVAKCLKSFGGDELACVAFLKKYALRDNNDEILEFTLDEAKNRWASTMAEAEKLFDGRRAKSQEYFKELYEYMLPAGRQMYALGNPYVAKATLSNCYVTKIEDDSIEGIFEAAKKTAKTFSYGGGIGLCIGELRPADARVSNSARCSSGAVSFMDLYSLTTGLIGQKSRRGAQMVTIPVSHPDIERFIEAKHINKEKLEFVNISVKITDDFMKAVENNDDFILSFKTHHETIERKVKARELWNKIIQSATDSAEPGILFWDRIVEKSPSEVYPSMRVHSTNPCITGDTLVYVADGRGHVSIKQLAEEKNDVPVFCLDRDNKVAVRYMRNPRITGYKQPIYKITFDDGNSIRTTANHKFMLKDCTYRRVDELKEGESLKIVSKFEANLKGIKTKNNQEYVWINNGFSKNIAEHRLIASFHQNIELDRGTVVYHKDHNGKNNFPSNLEILNKSEHDKLHGQNMLGDKNPMRRAKTEWSPEKWEEYRLKMSNAIKESKNGRFSGISNERLKKHAMILTKKLGYRFSAKDWKKYAEANNLVKQFSKWRNDHFGGILGLAKWAANECGLENVDLDPRSQRHYLKLLEQGYDCVIKDKKIFVVKNCEICGEKFEVHHSHRESGICSKNCHAVCMSERNKNSESARRATENSRKRWAEKKKENAKKQVEAYIELKFEIKRDPKKLEWEEYCKVNGIPYRLYKPSYFESFAQLKEAASNYNHKVVSVEFCGYEDVYNGTVDEFHNYFVGGFESKTQSGRKKFVYFNNLNCGEQSLEPGGACCLASLLLHKFVENPFTEEAKFNYELFSTMIWRAVRHLDNIVELNFGKHALEEQEEAAKAGRRIGLGITGLADMLASLGIRYDSEEAFKLVSAIMEFKKLQEYGASIDLARERGPFPLFDAKKHFSRGFCADLPQDLKDLACEHGLRNVALSTVAPNGTLSVVAQCSSGIEPIFALSYSRAVQMGGEKQEFKVFHQGLARFLNYYEKNVDDDLNDDLNNLPDYWVVSHEINYENRVKLQGVVQQHVDASISSTINLPKDTEPKMVDTIYRTAWKAGLKGVTVYVEGSRKGILVTDEFAKQAGIPSMNSVVHCVRAEGGDKFYIIVSYYNREIDKPYQVFVMNYKKAECDAFVKIGNALIKMLREQKISEKRIQKYIDRSTNSLAKLTRFLSLSMKTNNLERALIILDEHAFAGTLAAKLYQILSDSAVAKKSKCPMCGSTNLRMEEGCLRCLDCQWSGCN